VRREATPLFEHGGNERVIQNDIPVRAAFQHVSQRQAGEIWRSDRSRQKRMLSPATWRSADSVALDRTSRAS